MRVQRGWEYLRKLGKTPQVPRDSPLCLPRTGFSHPSFAEWVVDEGYIVAVTGITWIWERRSITTGEKAYSTTH